MKRSSCASGSGYVPSYSIGFCVAATMNGRASSYVVPSIVTWFSCMHSSSAACVLGGARLISSPRTRLANTGPGRNSNSFERWLKTFTPVTSDGSRSGVNWRRENEASTERASAFASIVFPTPGKSSMITWPSLTSESTASRSVSRGACTTRATLSVIRSIVSADSAASTCLPTARSSMLLLLQPDGLAEVGGEADEELTGPAALAESAQDVQRRLELDRPGARVLRALVGARGGRAVVGDGGGHDDEVGLLRAGERLAGDVLGGGRVDGLDPGRRRHGEVRREERHVGAEAGRLGGDGDPHAPRGAVAHEAHRVERLARSACRDEDAEAGERRAILRLRPGRRALQQLGAARVDLLRLGHPPHAPLALGRVALVRADELDAAGAQELGVRARGRVAPHARVHGRRDDDRAAMGERRLREDAVGEPVHELRQRVRGAGRDDEEVGAAEVRVRIVAGGPARQGGEGLGAHEALRR